MTLKQITLRKVDIGACTAFLILGGIVIYDAFKLGPGWGRDGPQPGFFPFVLSLMMVVGALISLAQTIINRDLRPFFEVRQEVVDLTKVGIPVAVAIMSITWLGLYLMAAVYVGLFTWWYGRFRWYWSIVAGVAVAGVTFMILSEGFHINMPKSFLYGLRLPILHLRLPV